MKFYGNWQHTKIKKPFTINCLSLARISVPDEKICTLTKKSVPWLENLYPEEIFCTWREFLYFDEKIWTTDVQVLS